ncbi:MAG TPA: DUF2723 domain-containing protein [Candidatus Limnocylindria bacterium]|nr:DUF2723 domain-containing protein [Candidatus Limnocylindria bacterium]
MTASVVPSAPTARAVPRIDARLLGFAPPAAVAAIVIANAWSGLMPGVGFWDTGEFQTILPIMGTAHPTGYPTYVLLGFVANLLLFPIGEPAFRVTVLSLLAVALAAAATVVLVRRLTGSTVVGIAAGLGLATTPVVWANATRADPHPIHLAFMALLLLALVRWEQGRRALIEAARDPEAQGAAEGDVALPSDRSVDRRLILAAIIFGLAAGNHSLTLLLIPPIVLFVLATEPGILRRPRLILTCLAATAVTVAVVFLELPIRGGLIPAPLIYAKPATWDGFWYIALAEQFRGALGDPFANLPAKLEKLTTFTTGQIGLLALAIPPAIVIAAARAPRYTLLTGLAIVITVLFNQAYANADIDRYYLGPVLIVWTWLAILAAEVATLAAVLLTSFTAGPNAPLESPAARRVSVAVAVILGIGLLMPALADEGDRRHRADRSGDVGAVRWLAETLPQLAPNAVIVSWWTTSTPLWYAQKVQGLRPDLFIVDDRTMLDLDLGRAPDVIRRYLAEGRSVYAIRVDSNGDLAELTSQFDMTLVASGGSTGVWAVHGPLSQ